MSGIIKNRQACVLKPRLILVLALAILFMGACTTLEEGMPAGDENWSFVVIGDVQQGYGVFGKLAKSIGNISPVPCAAFSCGDIMLRAGNEVEWVNFHRYSSPITDKMPLYIARGNHDGNDPASEEILRENMVHDGGHFYYSQRFNRAIFFILDTEIRREEGSISGIQLSWLADQLDSAQADPQLRDIFLIMHRPLFPQGFHRGSDLLNADALHALFLSHDKVRAVFAGHDHLFNKYSLDGLPYITSGGAGAPLYHGYGGDYFHFVKVSFYEEARRINVKTIGLFNEVVEDFDL